MENYYFFSPFFSFGNYSDLFCFAFLPNKLCKIACLPIVAPKYANNDIILGPMLRAQFQALGQMGNYSKKYGICNV